MVVRGEGGRSQTQKQCGCRGECGGSVGWERRVQARGFLFLPKKKGLPSKGAPTLFLCCDLLGQTHARADREKERARTERRTCTYVGISVTDTWMDGD